MRRAKVLFFLLIFELLVSECTRQGSFPHEPERRRPSPDNIATASTFFSGVPSIQASTFIEPQTPVQSTAKPFINQLVTSSFQVPNTLSTTRNITENTVVMYTTSSFIVITSTQVSVVKTSSNQNTGPSLTPSISEDKLHTTAGSSSHIINTTDPAVEQSKPESTKSILLSTESGVESSNQEFMPPGPNSGPISPNNRATEGNREELTPNGPGGVSTTQISDTAKRKDNGNKPTFDFENQNTFEFDGRVTTSSKIPSFPDVSTKVGSDLNPDQVTGKPTISGGAPNPDDDDDKKDQGHSKNGPGEGSKNPNDKNVPDVNKRNPNGGPNEPNIPNIGPKFPTDDNKKLPGGSGPGIKGQIPPDDKIMPDLDNKDINNRKNIPDIKPQVPPDNKNIPDINKRYPNINNSNNDPSDDKNVPDVFRRQPNDGPNSSNFPRKGSLNPIDDKYVPDRKRPSDDRNRPENPSDDKNTPDVFQRQPNDGRNRPNVPERGPSYPNDDRYIPDRKQPNDDRNRPDNPNMGPGYLPDDSIVPDVVRRQPNDGKNRPNFPERGPSYPNDDRYLPESDRRRPYDGKNRPDNPNIRPDNIPDDSNIPDRRQPNDRRNRPNNPDMEFENPSDDRNNNPRQPNDDRYRPDNPNVRPQYFPDDRNTPDILERPSYDGKNKPNIPNNRPQNSPDDRNFPDIYRGQPNDRRYPSGNPNVFPNGKNPDFSNKYPYDGKTYSPDVSKFYPNDGKNVPEGPRYPGDRNYPDNTGRYPYDGTKPPFNKNVPDIFPFDVDNPSDFGPNKYTTRSTMKTYDMRDTEGITLRPTTEIWSFRASDGLTRTSPSWFSTIKNYRPTDGSVDGDAERISPRGPTRPTLPTTQFKFSKKDPNNKREGWNRHSILNGGD